MKLVAYFSATGTTPTTLVKLTAKGVGGAELN